MNNDEIRKEIYSNLKERQNSYLDLIQKLWIFKLTTLGVVISIAILNDKLFSVNNEQIGIRAEDIMFVGLITLPFISFIIDIKVLETGLHVKGISDYIRNEFADVPEIYKWEDSIWARGSAFNMRTVLTVGNAIGTSILVLILSFYFASNLKPDNTSYLIIIGSLFIAIPFICSVIFYLTFFKKSSPLMYKK